MLKVLYINNNINLLINLYRFSFLLFHKYSENRIDEYELKPLNVKVYLSFTFKKIRISSEEEILP